MACTLNPSDTNELPPHEEKKKGGWGWGNLNERILSGERVTQMTTHAVRGLECSSKI